MEKTWPSLLMVYFYLLAAGLHLFLGLLGFFDTYKDAPILYSASYLALLSVVLFAPRFTGAAFTARMMFLSFMVIQAEPEPLESLWKVQLPAQAVMWTVFLGKKGIYLSGFSLVYLFYHGWGDMQHLELLFMTASGILAVNITLLIHFQRQETFKDELRKESRVKEAFLSKTSHELRTPIAVIVQYIEHLAAQQSYDQEAVEAIATASKQSLMLISDILSWSRISGGAALVFNAQTFPLQELASEVERMSGELVKQKPGVDFVMQCQRSTSVYTDKDRLLQVVNGLIMNSLKFTSEGSITCSMQCTGTLGTTLLQIVVQDTGCGFTASARRHMFEEFYKGSADSKGVGLGLSIAKAICKQMGGSIDAFSEGPGHGAQFVLKIPLEGAVARLQSASKTPSVSRVESISSDEDDTRQRTVMLVEDNALLRRVMARQLDTLGFQVMPASDALEAVRLLETHRVDAVIADVLMPFMSGLELTALIRSRESLKHLWIIGASALTDSTHSKRAMEVGMDLYLTKPVTQEKLRHSLRKFIDE